MSRVPTRYFYLATLAGGADADVWFLKRQIVVSLLCRFSMAVGLLTRFSSSRRLDESPMYNGDVWRASLISVKRD